MMIIVIYATVADAHLDNDDAKWQIHLAFEGGSVKHNKVGTEIIMRNNHSWYFRKKFQD